MLALQLLLSGVLIFVKLKTNITSDVTDESNYGA
jgi:hypothetical protein